MVLPQDDDDEHSVVADKNFTIASLGLRNLSMASSTLAFAKQVLSGSRLHGRVLAQVCGAVTSPSTSTTQSKTVAHKQLVYSEARTTCSDVPVVCEGFNPVRGEIAMPANLAAIAASSGYGTRRFKVLAL